MGTGSQRHQCAQLCVNTVGSYRCSCRRQYQLARDGVSCTGQRLIPPGVSRELANLHCFFVFIIIFLFIIILFFMFLPFFILSFVILLCGAKFWVKMILTRPRYRDDLAHIWPSPSDVNECNSTDERRHNCEHFCTNVVGSFLCSCIAGYRLTNDLFSCEGQLPSSSHDGAASTSRCIATRRQIADDSPIMFSWTASCFA